MAVPLIEGLQRPDAYPHPSEPVRLVETHISWVLLAGDFAYKVKKPVDFGFVDFSSLERRRRFCEEELRLNRRLAPQLYLGVVPITGPAAAPRVGGEGEAIEYAVKMRRFRRADEFAALAARGALGAAHVEALAALIADFHSESDRNPADPGWGAPEQVLSHWVGNFEVLARTGMAAAERPRLAALEAWMRGQHARLAPLIASRRAEGFVRECHGDLHLANVVLIEGRPVPFDALEFDPGLRWTDVVAEVAFTSMDLERLGHPALARRFLDAWLERSGDFAGLALLPAMLAYRALVRAKVAALRATQAAQGDEQEEALAEMRADIALAERFATPRPHAIAITMGLSGSGKSRLALALAETGDWVRIRSDVERKRLAGLSAADRAGAPPGAGLYAPGRTGQVYERLALLAGTVADAGFPALVDATFLRRGQRDAFRRLAAERGAGFAILAADAPIALLRERVQARAQAGSDPSDATVEVLEAQLATLEALGADEESCALRVDTSTRTDAAALGQALLSRCIPPRIPPPR
ncbi:MAG: AAA family ATPase [Gammaproteobacteria bacterium]